MTSTEAINELKTRMNASILGQEDLVNRLILVLLADGNMLLEGLPGLAKTRAIKTMAKELDCGLSRIQFTPDLLPSDITGTEIYEPELEERFVFQQGPVFSNLILADEINRSPAKVQAALLEAMEERQVSVAGKTYAMEPLFMVMATQNPIEQEGTYPLPEAQMDRFLMHVIIGYPDEASEVGIIRLNRKEQHASGKQEPKEKLSPEHIFEARKAIAGVTISEAMEKYIVDIISATRYPERFDEELATWLDFGASPRGSIALDRCSRVNAWMNGRDHVTPDDIREVVNDCLRHRMVLSYEARAEGITHNKVLERVLSKVAVLA